MMATMSFGQRVYTKQFADKGLVHKAAQWCSQGEWKNGFTKAEPDEMVNLTEFYLQYNKRPELWKALFNWLETTDLLTIKAGKHLIPGTNLVASVEDSENGELAKRKTESHNFNIDFMYVVKGKEGFRRLDHKSSTMTSKYKYDVNRYDYDAEKAEVLESTPGRFMIMFPDDWHIAKVKTQEADQKIRVIVVKMPYVLGK